MLGGGCTEFDSSDDAISTAFEVVLMKSDVSGSSDTQIHLSVQIR